MSLIDYHCLVEGCDKTYKGKSAQSSLHRHIRLKHPEYNPAQRVHDVTTIKEKRKERNRRYNAKYPMRNLALTRLKALKNLCSVQLKKQWIEKKPKRMPEPIFKGYIEPNNVYYLLEEECGVYAGRVAKKYEWEEACRVCD